MSEINWPDIYAAEVVSIHECWNTCGGYCCKNPFSSFLKVLEKHTISLPLMEDEYRYYTSIGGVKNITSPAKKSHFTLENGRSFDLYFLSCSCEGLCEPNSSRPLICRIYPYFPIVNAKGEILDFDYCSLTDIFYTSPQQNHNCTLVTDPEFNSQIREQLKTGLAGILKSPRYIFLFMISKLFIDAFREAVPERLDTINTEKIGAFVRKYEMALLLGKPWRKPAFRAKINEAYDDVKNAWNGDFL